ncbi:MAG: helix-turn-helix domain-containing protein [Verrucomicrobiia bacterium]
MDALVSSAAQLLAVGDPLGALKKVALRNDPPALSLRGIAMAQLGDYKLARRLLRRAARSFGPRDALARARCRVAEAEVALAARELTRPIPLLTVAKTLDALGDRGNALHARLVEARRELLTGELEAAARILSRATASIDQVPPALLARLELTRAELALRRVRVTEASVALARAEAAAAKSGIAALSAEVGRVRGALSSPSARVTRAGVVRLARLDEIESLFASGELIVDGCRRVIRCGGSVITLKGRPILFSLVTALAEPWPADVTREHLIERAFHARKSNESHRARLRVEIGRLRAVLRPLAQIRATPRGFTLVPIQAESVVTLTPPVDGSAGAILALLESGESWTTSALAYALGSSQRTVQRALGPVHEAGAVRTTGRGRARRWLAPAFGGFAATLLLPGALVVS